MQDIVRGWKDEIYYQELGEEKRVQLPENPAGSLGLTDNELEIVYGGRSDGHEQGGTTCGVICIYIASFLVAVCS